MSQNKKMKIKLVHSVAGCNVRQSQTVKGLGLTKINQVKETYMQWYVTITINTHYLKRVSPAEVSISY